MKLEYENMINGAKATVKTGRTGSYTENPPAIVGSGMHYTVASGTTFTCTGYYVVVSGSYWYLQTTAGVWLLTEPYGDSAWLLTETSRKVQYSAAQAQSYIDRMIENNKQIVSCNLFCARFAYKLTTKEKQLLYDLQTRLQERNQRLMSDGLVSGITTSTPAGYSQLQNYMQQFMASGGVGLVISTTAAIVISCVVVASLSTAAYFAYKYLFEQSADDVKYSKQLTSTLMAKLTPEEYDQLMRETQGVVTKSKIKQMLSTSSGMLKWALIGTAAYLLYDKFFQKKGGKE